MVFRIESLRAANFAVQNSEIAKIEKTGDVFTEAKIKKAVNKNGITLFTHTPPKVQNNKFHPLLYHIVQIKSM